MLVTRLPNIDRLFAPMGRVRSTPVTGMSTGVLVRVPAGGGRVTMLVAVGVGEIVLPELAGAVRVVVGVTVGVALGWRVSVRVGVGVIEGSTPGSLVNVLVGVCVMEGITTVRVTVEVGVGVKEGILNSFRDG